MLKINIIGFSVNSILVMYLMGSDDINKEFVLSWVTCLNSLRSKSSENQK